ncbi:zinc metalloprotease [Paenibacillus yonginensis]|uniref:Zinc metalloprotease n=1 Tax=Paenibacillus yonginensis TaxID=1462996 RepID=A0A1B1N178_9BACL|nr:site-2 protease family protein [Paenibacillus yonginensis]ANS75173.1 zinc metalloprotease [Paenibacillus yonginensis]
MGFLNSIFAFPLDVLPFILVVILIAFTFHEFAHAYTAYKFGDPTAKMLGRVTLNPASHIELFGTLMILLLGFGWARPVPVNRDNFSKPRLMGIIVSFVGPLSNLVIGFVATIVYVALINAGVIGGEGASRFQVAVQLFLYYLSILNIGLFLFNLLPLPPLDGYRIVEDLVPRRIRPMLQQYEQWASLIFLLFVFIPPLRAVTIAPLYGLIYHIFHAFTRVSLSLFG